MTDKEDDHMNIKLITLRIFGKYWNDSNGCCSGSSLSSYN